MRRSTRTVLLLLCLALGASAAHAAEIPFGPQEIVSTSEGYGIDVIAGDVDGDGDLDLVGIGGTNPPSGVYWYKNLDGAGTFSSAHLIDGSSGQLGTPVSIELVDMDQDGDPDLLTGTFSDCFWYPNDGLGNFGARTVVRNDWGFVMFRAADIDGDGDPDVVGVIGFDANKIAWFRNNGGGAFNPATENVIDALPNGTGEGDVVPADIDGDGAVDLVVLQSAGGDQVAWYRNTDGAGTFSAKQTIATFPGNAGGVALTDIDVDGDLDVVSADYSFNNVRWHENTAGDGSAWTDHTIATSDCVSFFVETADMDLDGDPDILVATRVTNQARWIENTAGNGTAWTNRLITGGVDWPLATIAADIDGDGDPDVATASLGDTKFAWNENRTIHRNAAFAAPSEIPSLGIPESTIAADVDGDGDMDALSAYANRFVWFESDGATPPVFAERTISSSVFAPSSIFAADVDGDGDMDAFLTGPGNDTIAWYENDGAQPPVWTQHAIGGAADPVSVFAADVDGDGDIDALLASLNDSTIRWYENNGAQPPVWTERTITISASGASSVVAADVDGDGDMDALSASAGDNKIAWYENDGANPPGWTARTISTAASNAWSVVAADVDGDGDMDAISASLADNKIAWYENNGASPPVWAARTITTAAIGAVSVAARDLDGDGDVDVLSASQTDKRLAWYENNGGAPPAFTPRTIGTATNVARSVLAADMDGDGDADVLSAYDGTTWFENRGGQFAFTGEDMSTGSAYDAELAPMLAVGVRVHGRPGDSVGRVATLDLRFGAPTGFFGGALLNSTQANALFDELRIYRDEGSGRFEAGEDTLVTTVTTLSLTAGVQTVTLPAGDPNVRVAAPATFFAVGLMSPAASQQSVNEFDVTHLAAAGSAVVDANAGIALAGEPAGNPSTLSIQARSRLVVNSTIDAVDAAPGDGLCATSGGACTLRAAIQEANAHAGNDRIVLGAGTYTLSIPGRTDDAASTGDLDITENFATTTVVGAGAGRTIISGGGIDRVFHVRNGSSAVFEDLTVTGGVDPTSGTYTQGGGIFFDFTRGGAIRRCEIRGNSAAGGGGGLAASAVITDPLEVVDTVFYGNVSGGSSDAIENVASTMNLTNCTISGHNLSGFHKVVLNQSDGSSRINIKHSTITNNSLGIESFSAANWISIENSIVAGNGPGSDINGFTIVSLGHNLIGRGFGVTNFTPQPGDQVGTAGTPIDPRLAPLGDYGGPTLTHRLQPTSPAVDAGACGTTPVDQRGVKRPIDVTGVANVGDGCDIGAYELESGAALSRIEVPVRWCGLRGSPSIETPALMGAGNTNDLLRRRHEVATDNIYAPQTGIIFRSAANFTVQNYPLLEDPDCVQVTPGNFSCTRGARGDVYIDPEAAIFDEYEELIAACRAAWHAQDPKTEGITAVQVNRFVDKNGNALSILGIGGRAKQGDAREQAEAGRVAVVDSYYRQSANPADTIDRLLAHELGHAVSLRHGDGIDNDGNAIIDDDDEAFLGLPRFDGVNVMQYREGSTITSGQAAQARNHLSATVPDVSVQPFSDAAPDAVPIDPKNARVLEFGFDGVLNLANARVLEFKNASVLEFENDAILDFANARVLEFKNASVLEFKNARVLEFGMSYDGETPAASSRLHATTAAIPWPPSLRPKTRYFFYLDVDRDDATGGYPADEVNPSDAPNRFPGSNNFVSSPNVAEEAGVDLIAQVEIESTCAGTDCSTASQVRIFDYNDGTGVYTQVSSGPSPAITAVDVGLYVDNGGAPVDLDAAPTGITVQPAIPNSLLFAAGWGFTTPPGGGAPVPNPIRMEVVTTIGCAGNILNDGSASDSRNCQCVSCALCPDYPGCVGAVGTPQTLAGTTILTDDKSAELTFQPPILPVCTVVPALASQGQPVTVYVTQLSTGLAGTVEVTRAGTVIGTAPTGAISAAGTVSVAATLPSTALGQVTLSTGITGYAPRAQCLVTVTPTLACPDADADGSCDSVDSDDDNDGVADAGDAAPLNRLVCRDLDLDQCDDCAGGVNAPLRDGPDYDHDGICDRGDADDDNDGVLDGSDGQPFNVNACGDIDGDHCDDCVVTGTPSPGNDGPDADSDGLCDFGDHDFDGDGTLDWTDCAPSDATAKAAPVEVAGFGFGTAGNKNRLTWTAPQAQGGSGTVSDVLRGTRAGLPVGSGAETCVATGISAAQHDDATSPTSGQVLWYLARARNACGTGGYGTRGGGTERMSGTCP